MELKDIIKSTAKIFLKYGIRSVTMDDVAKELSISKKTLYQYVTDKNDLVEKSVLYISSTFDSCHKESENKKNIIEKYIDLYKEISETLKENNQSFEYDLNKYYPKQFQILKNHRRKIITTKMTKDMEEGIEQGFFRPEINIKKIVLLHLIRIESLKDNELLIKYNYTLVDIIEEMFSYHLHAITTPKGINEYKRLKLITNE